MAVRVQNTKGFAGFGLIPCPAPSVRGASGGCCIPARISTTGRDMCCGPKYLSNLTRTIQRDGKWKIICNPKTTTSGGDGGSGGGGTVIGGSGSGGSTSGGTGGVSDIGGGFGLPPEIFTYGLYAIIGLIGFKVITSVMKSRSGGRQRVKS